MKKALVSFSFHKFFELIKATTQPLKNYQNYCRNSLKSKNEVHEIRGALTLTLYAPTPQNSETKSVFDHFVRLALKGITSGCSDPPALDS